YILIDKKSCRILTMKDYIDTLRNEILSPRTKFKRLQKENGLSNINQTIIRLSNLDYLKSLGAFFTPQELTTAAISQFSTAITTKSVVLDPCCGVGNLLIESSRQLGVSSSLSSTLQQWGSVLWGYDIEPNFIEITKLRLIIDALARGVELDCSIEQACNYLSNIEVKDALSVTRMELESVTHLFINPPFISIDSPKRDYWKQGKVNSAGVFFDFYLRALPIECDVVAILPDVLRSGSRYQSFRNFVDENLQGVCQIKGRFSAIADVDVFILAGRVKKTTNHIQWVETSHCDVALGDKYDVMIGPLVAYRDEQVGQSYPYFHPKNCKNWQVITTADEYRKFSGRVVSPPCVVIKRTSSPSDKYRAAATLINLKEPVAVENHLIVVTPKDKTLKSCQKLLKLLAKDEVNQFINQCIRARHLTVGVIKTIPLQF
ncbi:N-6 DNA methylase, partial [Pasteurella multocida]